MSLWKSVALAIYLSLFSIVTLAQDCTQKSPNFEKQGDKYFEISDGKPLTKKQTAKIKKIIASIKRRLKGKSTSIGCDNVTTKAKVTAETSVDDNGLLSLKLEIYDKKKKSTYYETLNYFGNNIYQNIIKTSSNTFSIHSKQRHRIGRRGITTLVEELISLKINRGGISISMSKYYNGYFAFTRTLTLKP